MEISRATCPACGHIVATGRLIKGNRQKFKCKKCTTVFTLIDHNAQEEAAERAFMLAEDIDDSGIVI